MRDGTGRVMSVSSSLRGEREHYHKDNLRHLPRFPGFFVTFRILVTRSFRPPSSRLRLSGDERNVRRTKGGGNWNGECVTNGGNEACTGRILGSLPVPFVRSVCRSVSSLPSLRSLTRLLTFLTSLGSVTRSLHRSLRHVFRHS